MNYGEFFLGPTHESFLRKLVALIAFYAFFPTNLELIGVAVAYTGGSHNEHAQVAHFHRSSSAVRSQPQIRSPPKVDRAVGGTAAARPRAHVHSRRQALEEDCRRVQGACGPSPPLEAMVESG